MAIKCATCIALRIKILEGVIVSSYCALTGDDVSPHDFSCQDYEEAKAVWKRDKRDDSIMKRR